MTKEIKDWSKQISGLEQLGIDDTTGLYSEILATAHDVGYKVPDEQLIETEDADALKKVIPDLHKGLMKFHDAAKKEAAAKETATEKKPAAKKREAAPKTKTAKTPKKQATPAVQKEVVDKSKDANMATAKTAKKAAAKPAKKTAKKAAPAKGKKTAAANARTPVSRNPFGDNAVIKVLNKDHGIKPGSQRGDRVAVVMKYNGKKVADFFAKEKAPFNRTDTLRFLIDKGVITVK